MGRNRHKKQRDNGNTIAWAERELAKGNIKEALKAAKNCYRTEPSPECRRVLEQAYLSRVEQLHRMKLTEEARAVLADLLELQPTTGAVQGQIPRLQLLVGAAGVNSAEMFQRDPALLVEIVDQTMLDPKALPPDVESVRRQVEHVRAALAAVETGEDDRATELLREIPRNSPLADWKLLVRGLSAFYQSDDERMRQNWSRLDAHRPAWRIASTLQAAAGETLEEAARLAVTTSLKRLEAWSHDESLTPLLKRLREHWTSGEWREFFQNFRRLRNRGEKTQPELIAGLVDMLWKRAVREEDEDLLETLQRTAPAPPLDPQWHRAQALLQEALQESIECTSECWSSYRESLRSAGALRDDALRDDERPIAAALVDLHVARLQISVAEEYLRDMGGELEDDANILFESAARHLLAGIRHHPPLLAAYRELSKLHDRLEQPEKSAAALRHLLEHSPDDYEAHAKLAALYLELEQLEKSEPHIAAIARLRPRGQETRALRWNHGLAMVRALTKAKQFEAARQELKRIEGETPPFAPPFFLPSIRSAIEWKADCTIPAEQHLNEALATVKEPASVWMQMAALAARYSLPAKLRKGFNERFKQAIESKPTSETAGHLARILSAYRTSEANYTGRATHERLVIAYLKRAKQMRWQEADLKSACLFSEVVNDARLRKELLDKGEKKFPGNPCFAIWSAIDEIRELSNRRRRGSIYAASQILAGLCAKVEAALAKARAAAPRDERLIELGETLLADLQHAKEVLSPPLPFFAWDDDDDDEDEDDEYGAYDDDEFEEESDDAGRFAGMPLDMGGMKAMFDDVMRTMPAEIKAEIERVAAEQGMTPQESFLAFLKAGVPADFAGIPFPDSPPKRPRRSRRD